MKSLRKYQNGEKALYVFNLKKPRIITIRGYKRKYESSYYLMNEGLGDIWVPEYWLKKLSCKKSHPL